MVHNNKGIIRNVMFFILDLFFKIVPNRNASKIIRNVINMEGLIEANTVTEKHGCVFLQDETIIRSQKYFDEIPCF